MSFIESIPAYHETMVVSLKPTLDKLRDIDFKFDAHDQAEEKGSHDCDCEYCPYGGVDVSKDMLDDGEITELSDDKKKLNAELAAALKAIKRLESYAAFVGKPLPDEVLVK